MRYRLKLLSKYAVFLIPCSLLLVSFFHKPLPAEPAAFKFPYQEAGLTTRQAAAHLISRFTFGATPGQVDEVVKMGLENWFNQQLKGNLADDSLQLKLAAYDALKMSNAEASEIFPRPNQVVRMAKKEGTTFSKDSSQDKKEYRKAILAYARQKNLRPQAELLRQFINAKMLRAAYSNNQLHEILTDFWFNHFNVSITKKDCALFIPAYERDVIRQHVTGRFEDMLIATAKSPAMLLYLDNFNSAAQNNEMQANNNDNARRLKRMQRMADAQGDSASQPVVNQLKKKKAQGLNENYAREVMELHTLGVDGGYTQSDVTQAARILTGWTIYPMETKYGNAAKKFIEKTGEDELEKRGFVHDGDFLFAMNRHDNNEKTVLGKKFPANGGYEEGVQLLKMLAHNPSTAAFICNKLAVHFVSDNPPDALVKKMTKTFLDKDGDIKEVLLTMVSSREFWNKTVVRDKTKSPFELAISTVRALNADIEQPYRLFGWVEKMGQKVYYYQAPTGFPDKAQYSINTGALLNRMNCGLSIASGEMRGVKTDLLRLNNNHEPESASAALVTYGKLLMPERDLTETIRRLTPLLTEPALEKKLDDVTVKPVVNKTVPNATGDEVAMEEEMKKDEPDKRTAREMKALPNMMLSQVVGIIIGSPEFQRK